VVVAGNHDSASRLEAPEALLRVMRVYMVDGLPRLGREALDLELEYGGSPMLVPA
jgi:DNA repair exonuclease SbcCD nuclease subunit